MFLPRIPRGNPPKGYGLQQRADPFFTRMKTWRTKPCLPCPSSPPVESLLIDEAKSSCLSRFRRALGDLHILTRQWSGKTARCRCRCRPTSSFQATDAGHRAMPKAAAQGGKKKKKKRIGRGRWNEFPKLDPCPFTLPFCRLPTY